MPKMKSVSCAKKRFKVTGSGKILYAKSHHNHCLSTKNAKRGRRLRKMSLVDSTNQPAVERMLLMR